MNLRQLRFHVGMSVESLAGRLNVHPRTVVHRESSPIRNLPLGTVIEHCEALGLTVEVTVSRPDGWKETIG